MPAPRTTPLVAALLLVLTGCSGGDGGGAVDVPPAAPAAPASTTTPAPLTGVELPADPLVALVPKPSEVPSGLTPLLKATGARDLQTVASYSGTGAAQQAAAATSLRAHGFVHAYTVQYADPASGRVLSVLVSQFATASGATADLASDLRTTVGAVVPSPTLGEQSSVQIEALMGASRAQLVVVRFRRGVDTWSVAYEATPTAEPTLVTGIVRTVLARAAA